MFRNVYYKYKPYLIFLSLTLFFYGYFLFTNKGILVWYGDSFDQQINFYMGGWEKFHALDFSLWEWSLGFGGNYLSYIFYFATSPFFFIYCFFPKESIVYLFLIFNAIKIFLLLTFSYLWLKQLTDSENHAIIGSIILTFSGWIAFFFHYNQFLDIFIYYPLILFFIEKWLDDGSHLILIALIGLLGIINFYFLYMFIPFIVLYVIYRLHVLKKPFITEILKMAGIGILGVGLASILLLPSISIILKTERLNSNISLFSILSIKDMYRYISTLFTPVMERFDPSYYLSTDVYGGLGWSGGVSLFASILTPLLIPLSLFPIKNNKNRYNFIFYAVLFIFATFLIFYKLLQGSVDVRWYYMFTLLNTLLVVQSLDHIKNKGLNVKRYLANVVMLIAVICIFLSISYYKHWYGDIAHLKQLIFVSLLMVILILVYSYLIIRKINILWILFVVIFEMTFSFYLPIKNDPPILANDLMENFQTSSDAINFIKENDKGYYRIINDTGMLSSANEPFAFNYPGISFYTSVYNYEQDGFLNRMRSTWSMPVTFGRNYTYLLTSVKYFVTDDNNHLPPYGFEFVKQIGKDSIYLNRYYFPLGYATQTTINVDIFNSLSYFNQDRLLMDHIVTSSSENYDVEYFNSIQTLYAWTNSDQQYVQLNTTEPYNIYVESFDIPRITIDQFSNNELVHSSYTWQYNYTGTFVDPATSSDYVVVTPDNVYQSNTQLNYYIESQLSDYDQWYSYVSNHSFYNVKLSQDRIEANIHIINELEWVFTSIPYDEGWTVYIDGTKIDYEKVDLGFIGFKLDQGIHTVEFKYIPTYLKEGGMISAFSLLIYIILLTKHKHQ